MTECSFGYRAQMESGKEMVGTINAESEESARSAIEALNLKVMDIWKAGTAIRGGPLTAAEFKAFNEQLVMLVKAGLPLEAGMELLSAGMGGRHANIVAAINTDMKAGMTLAQAVEKHGRRFPPDYAMLLDAAVKTNSLSDVLVNLSHHLELRRKLHESLFNALGYPAFVLAAMIIVGAIFSWYVLPLYAQLAVASIHGTGFSRSTYTVPPPWPTEVLLVLGDNATLIIGIIVAIIISSILFWLLFRRRPIMLNFRDWVAGHVPVLGPAIRAAMIARWCDALRVGVISGMDLPQGIELACAVTGSPVMTACGSSMTFAMERGLPMDKALMESALPPAVGTAIQSGIAGNNLGETLTVLTQGYSKEAERRIAMLPAILTPLLLVVLSFIVAFVLWGLIAPFTVLLRSLTGS